MGGRNKILPLLSNRQVVAGCWSWHGHWHWHWDWHGSGRTASGLEQTVGKAKFAFTVDVVGCGRVVEESKQGHQQGAQVIKVGWVT